MGKLNTHSRGQTKAHGSEATRVNPATRLIILVILRSKHLVLTDVRTDKRVAAGDFVQRLNNVLGHDHLGTLKAILSP